VAVHRTQKRKKEKEKRTGTTSLRPRQFSNTRTQLIRSQCSQKSIILRKDEPIPSLIANVGAASHAALILSASYRKLPQSNERSQDALRRFAELSPLTDLGYVRNSTRRLHMLNTLFNRRMRTLHRQSNNTSRYGI